MTRVILTLVAVGDRKCQMMTARQADNTTRGMLWAGSSKCPSSVNSTLVPVIPRATIPSSMIRTLRRTVDSREVGVSWPVSMVMLALRSLCEVSWGVA